MSNVDVRELVAQALNNAWTCEVAAPPDFDEGAYLAAWPDVASAIQAGEIRSAFVHYVLVGRNEGRPRPSKNPT